MPRNKREPKIPADQARQGARLSAENARGLLEFAIAGAKCGRYGPAISLCVLSSEEGAKALALLMEAISPQPTGLSLADLLSKHKTKHDISSFVSLMLHLTDLMRLIKDEVEADVLDRVIDEKHAGSRWVSRIVDELRRMTTDIEAKETHFIAWYRHANKLKNDGLYVNWVDDAWHNPGAASAETFAEYRSYVEWWLNVVDEMLSLPSDTWESAFAKGLHAQKDSRPGTS